MKKWMIACTLFFFVAVAAVSYTRMQIVKPKTQAPSVCLKIGVERDYEPFAYVDASGKLTGFDVQLSYALCRRMNRVCTVESKRFHNLLPSLQSGKLDLVVAGVGQTSERNRNFSFSQTYYRSRSFFITNNTIEQRIAIDNAPQMIIGVQQGSLQEKFIREEYVPAGAKMVVFDTYSKMVEAINNSEINVIFTDGIPGYTLLNSPEGQKLNIGGRPKLELKEENVTSLTDAKIVARKEDAALIEEVNAALHQMQTGGEYQELHARFFPFVNF